MNERYKVEKAIIMAAGKGTRLYPITLSTPKPLVKVNGKMMIETIINALYDNDITEIHIVIGYLKECFSILKDKYPGIDLIENPYYDTCNNISSLYMARNHICNSIILDGDQIVYNPNILKPDFDRSGYNCTWSEDKTDEWLLTVENGIITKCDSKGGAHGWQLYSVSRWNETDGKKLKEQVETEFNVNRNRQIYWDDIALNFHPEDYKLGITEMKKDDIVEIDSLQDLIKIDPSYKSFAKDVTQ